MQKQKYFWFFLFIFCVAPFSLLFAAGPLFQGSLSDRYRFRTTGSLEDHDMETLFSLDVGSPHEGRFSGSLQAGGIFDLDGNQGGNTFTDIYNTFDSRAVGRLYYAFVDVKDLGPVNRLRGGRQHIYDIESLYFDGLTLESDPFYTFVLRAYGGVPVHLFENQIGDDAQGDWTVGGSLEWNPLSKFLARFDYTHLKDSVSGFRAGLGDQEDDLFATSLWWDVSKKITLSSRFTSFSDQVRDFSANGIYNLSEEDFSVYLNLYRLLEGYDVRVIEWDVYRIAGTYQPFTEFSLGATKGLGQHFVADGGVGARFLDDNQVASAFNHGYERFYLSLSSLKWPLKGMSLSLTGDYYHGEDNILDNNIFGLSFQGKQKLFKDRLKLVGGSLFYVYRYNLFSGEESDNVRTFFVGAEGKIIKRLDGKIRYEIESNRFNLFHTTEVSLKWTF